MTRLQTKIRKAARKAIDIAGSPGALAKLIDESPQTITNWRTRGVPPEKCRAVEAALQNRVTRYELQPEVFGEAP